MTFNPACIFIFLTMKDPKPDMSLKCWASLSYEGVKVMMSHKAIATESEVAAMQ